MINSNVYDPNYKPNEQPQNVPKRKTSDVIEIDLDHLENCD